MRIVLGVMCMWTHPALEQDRFPLVSFQGFLDCGEDWGVEGERVERLEIDKTVIFMSGTVAKIYLHILCKGSNKQLNALLLLTSMRKRWRYIRCRPWVTSTVFIANRLYNSKRNSNHRLPFHLILYSRSRREISVLSTRLSRRIQSF